MSLLMMLKSIKKANPSSISMWSSTVNIFEELLTLFSDKHQYFAKFEFCFRV